jgi:hypothetical protein
MKKYISFICLLGLFAIAQISTAKTVQKPARQYWCDMAYRIAHPLLQALSKGELKKTMPVEQPTGATGREYVTYLEATGRLLCGIAPWLETGESTGREGEQRAELIALAHQGIHNAVDSLSPDFLNFTPRHGGQPLVDAAFLAQAFLRSPKVLWGGLDKTTQQMVITAMRHTRDITPGYNNWLLFSATIEAFFLSVGEQYDAMRIDYAMRQHEQWYKGDGIYGDGPDYHADYYNSFVIQPMMVDISRVLVRHSMMSAQRAEELLRRSVRYATVLERLISPEGSYPPIGRSLAYRMGAFQTLAQVALLGRLPDTVHPAQVRCALTAVMRRQMEAPGTFDAHGWLQLGFCGHQISPAETYISTGSLYLCSVALLPLGLPAADSFWSAPDEPWTQAKAWSGQEFPIDHAIH